MSGGRYNSSKKLSEIILEVMREGDMSQRMLEHRAISLWQVIMGPTVNRVTKSVYMKSGVLYVELHSSVVRQELIMLKKTIIQKINEAVGQSAVSDIIFR